MQPTNIGFGTGKMRTCALYILTKIRKFHSDIIHRNFSPLFFFLGFYSPWKWLHFDMILVCLHVCFFFRGTWDEKITSRGKCIIGMHFHHYIISALIFTSKSWFVENNIQTQHEQQWKKKKRLIKNTKLKCSRDLFSVYCAYTREKYELRRSLKYARLINQM